MLVELVRSRELVVQSQVHDVRPLANGIHAHQPLVLRIGREYRWPHWAFEASVIAMFGTVGSVRPAGFHLPGAAGVCAWLADTRG